MENFLQNFAEQFDETPLDEISFDTRFKELDEWSSMTALTVIAMVDECYNKKLTGEDIRKSNTVKELYEIILNK